jgi:TonB-dependent SusC/RagA subfamily outer membrane receptor
MQAVQGSVSGVNITQTSSIPGEAPEVLVRGGGSISAKTDPYIIVDGIPITKMGGTMNDINPNDIKSIEILKDASAVAIYGMNGANGVILITTKQGKTETPTIRYTSYVGIEDFAHIPDFVTPEELLARYAEGNRIIERAKLNTEEAIKGKISGLDNHILLLPVPLSEIQLNKDVEWKQNPGY